MKTWRNIVIGLTFLAGIGIFRVPILGAVTGFYNSTVRIVDSTGNVLNGIASAVTAQFNSTVRVVDSTGHVIDSFGGGSGTVDSGTGPAIAQYPSGTGTEVGPATISGDATIAQGGALTVTKSSGNAFTSAAFGTALNLSVPPVIGGTTPVAGTFSTINQYNDQGTIASAGTLSCNEALGNICAAQVGGGAIMIANPTNAVIKQQYYLYFYTVTGTITATFGANWKYMNNGISSPAVASLPTFTIYTGAPAMVPYHYDGTNFVVDWSDMISAHRGVVGSLVANALFLGSNMTFPGDNTVATMARIPLAFSINQQTALVANEHMGTFKTVKAITIENIVLDAQNVTCAVSATVTCYDCGTAAGACTAGQTSTIATSAAIATGAVSSVDMTVSTANVAAAHYINCQITAGTCATLQASVQMMARPQ